MPRSCSFEKIEAKQEILNRLQAVHLISHFALNPEHL
jgi:hypothetical protein